MHCGFHRVFLFLPLLAHKMQNLDGERLIGRERESFDVGYVWQKPSNIFLSFTLCVVFTEHHTEIAAD